MLRLIDFKLDLELLIPYAYTERFSTLLYEQAIGKGKVATLNR